MLALVLPAMPLFAQGVCGPMDVVFVVDTTGSMGGAIDSVKTDLNTIVNQISDASGGDFQLGLVRFDTAVIVESDLATGNTDAFKAKINLLVASGGVGEPEASDEALNTVINHLKTTDRTAGQQVGNFNGLFRTGAARIIIIVTDARPAGFDDTYEDGVDDVNAHKFAAQAAAAGIHISAIFVPTSGSTSFGVSETVRKIMKDYASTSGGSYTEANPDGTGTSTAITSIVASCGGFTPGFFIGADPPLSFVSSGGTTDFLVSTGSFGRFDDDIVLSASDLPEGSSVTFDPPVILAPGSGTSVMHFDAGGNLFPGTYFITITGTSANGSVSRSTTVRIDVECNPPFIYGTPDVQPTSQTVASGGSATLSVSPNGTSPFTYQWYAGPSGSIYFPIANANSATLVTPPINTGSDFWVRVTNACGSYDSFTANVSVSAQGNTSSRGRAHAISPHP
jgi:uncharacterized protein YegL